MFILCATSANAAINCTEQVTRLITHKNGGVYFQTNKTCSQHWCKIDFPDEVQVTRAYSTLLTAKITQKNINFVWSNLGSCEEYNETHVSPEFFSI